MVSRKVKRMNKLIEVVGNNINYKLPVILDIETTGTYRFTENVTSVQLKWVHKDTQEVKEDFLVWSDYSVEEWTEFLQMFKDMKAKLITHGGKFDLLFLYHNTNVLLQVFADTFVMAHVLGENSLALKDLVGRYYKDFYDISLKDKIGKVTKKLIEYGIKDVRYTEKLYHKFKQKIIDNDLVTTYRHELRAYNAYIIVESKGVYVNPDKEKTRAYLQGEYKPLEEKLKEVANINWNSSLQVASILFNPIDCEIRSNPKTYRYWHVDLADGRDLWGIMQKNSIKFKTKKEATAYVKKALPHMKLKEFIFTQYKKEQTELLGFGLGLDVVKYTDRGNPSTDDEVLSKLEDKHEIIPILKEWKRLTKLEKFIDSWEKLMTDDGCIHPSFNITARTGRTTCKEPNLQQVPQNSHVRNMICAREGYKIIELDYSQLELRITAELSGDKNMIKAYKEGKDLHALTVKNLFGDIDLSDPDTAKRYRTYGKACFSGNTEILTDEGFVPFKLYDGLTPVAQYNIDSEEISYVKPLDFRMIPNQKICSFDNENTSLRLTPNHECIVQVCNNKKVITKKVPFEELSGHGQTKYAFINAGYFNYEGYDFIENDFTRLVSAFVADGSYITGSHSQLTFEFSKKRKTNRLRDILNNLSVSYKEIYTESTRVTKFIIDSFDVVTKMKRYCTLDKDLTLNALKELDPYEYLKEARYWDGHSYKGGLIRVSSTRKTTLDIMQIMAVHSGIRARITMRLEGEGNRNTVWEISYNLNKKPVSRFISSDIDTRTFHNTNHNVYCVTVPEHNIVIRHDGKVSIQGNCNFGFIYGMQPKAFQDYAKGYGLSLSMKEAKEFRESFLRGYPALPDWWEESKSFARTYGYSETLTGRKRFLPDIWSPNFADSSSAERQSINSPVQGFGSDICISAMSDIVFSKELDHSKFHVLGTVHDAILMEVKEDYAEELGRKAKEIMEKPTLLKDIELDVPLVADLEISWAWGGH